MKISAKHLSKGVLTGITRIAQESLFSGVNNLEVYSLLREEYGQYFGFTEEEVAKLKNEASLQSSSIEDIKPKSFLINLRTKLLLFDLV